MPRPNGDGGRECRREGCTERRYSRVGMELHLATDHDLPEEFPA